MKNRSKADSVFNWINTVIVFLVTISILYPLIYMLSASFSDPTAVNSGNMWLLPKGVTLEGYQRLFQYSEVLYGYANTIIYSVIGTMVSLLVTLPCGYALSRIDFFGRKFLFAMVIITMFFAGGLIPTYLVIKEIDLLDRRLLIYILTATSPFHLIVCRTFFSTSVPVEVQESGIIDGCNNARLFMNIVLPLSKPVVAVMCLYFGVDHWNSYFMPMIYLSSRHLFPLQLILREILIQQQMALEMMASEDVVEALAEQARVAGMIRYGAIVISSFPVIAIYPFFQRYFVQGLTLGAVKG